MAYQHRPVIGLDDLSANLQRAMKLVTGPEAIDILLSGMEIIVERVQENVLAQGLVETGALFDSIKPVPFGYQAVHILVDVPYGAVHEYGLPNQPITPRQRAFFWAKWYETSDPMWRALALSATYTIPARPYLRPAVDTKKKQAVKQIAISLAIALTDKLRARAGML